MRQINADFSPRIARIYTRGSGLWINSTFLNSELNFFYLLSFFPFFYHFSFVFFLARGAGSPPLPFAPSPSLFLLSFFIFHIPAPLELCPRYPGGSNIPRPESFTADLYCIYIRNRTVFQNTRIFLRVFSGRNFYRNREAQYE